MASGKKGWNQFQEASEIELVAVIPDAKYWAASIVPKKVAATLTFAVYRSVSEFWPK